MKPIAILTCFLALSALAQNPGAVTPKPLTAFEQMLINQDKAVAQAQMKKDVDFFKRTVADDFMGVGTDGKVYGKEEIVEAAREFNLQEYTPYNLQVLPLNDSEAIVTYDCVVREAQFDETAPRYQHISNLWMKQGDQWRLKFQQSTALR
jgi:hypothetical protein